MELSARGAAARQSDVALPPIGSDGVQQTEVAEPPRPPPPRIMNPRVRRTFGCFKSQCWDRRPLRVGGWRVGLKPPPPLRIAVLCGDFVHNLRSSLDHHLCPADVERDDRRVRGIPPVVLGQIGKRGHGATHTTNAPAQTIRTTRANERRPAVVPYVEERRYAGDRQSLSSIRESVRFRRVTTLIS